MSSGGRVEVPTGSLGSRAERRPPLLVVSWRSPDTPSQLRLRALCEELSYSWAVHLAFFSGGRSDGDSVWIAHPAPPVVARPPRYTRADRMLAAATLRSPHTVALGGAVRRAWLEKLIREIDPAVVVLNGLPAAGALPPAEWRRAVLDSQQAEYPRLRRLAGRAGSGRASTGLLVRAALARRLEGRLARACAGVWAATEGDAAYFRSLGAQRVWTIHNGTRLPEAEILPHVDRRREDPVRLLHVLPPGSAAARAGLREFLEEWAPLLPEPWTLDVVGATMEPGSAIDPRVHLVGRVGNLALEYASHDALVVPFRQAEAARGEVLEACAMGLPVLATAAVAEGIGLVDGRTYLRAESAREAAERVRWLRDHPEALAGLAARAREHIRTFDWAVIGRIADAALQSVAENRARNR
ncbi:glycosyltransferase [Naasia sp. SYSU D00948]|uniref:glycosyltransferase n=1 Tax=Naasia sp. SYSU D00948 TaxID=2817379 RepID=UPI001B30503E|nr:glycosyltransferase [Naasia sp. SYSU D00948]